MTKHNFPSRSLFGIALALLGLLMLADALDIFPFFSFSFTRFIGRLWPFALLALGYLQLKSNRVGSGVFLSFLALIFAASSLFDTGFFTVVWPFLIIALGLRLCSTDRMTADPCAKSTIEEVSFFTHVRRKMSPEDLSGGNIYCAFGGVTIDAREAKLAERGGALTVSCIMGSVRIAVPAGMRITSSGRGIIGVWKIPATDTIPEGPMLKVRGISMLGNVEIVAFPEQNERT